MRRVAVLGCGMIGAAPADSPLGIQSHAAAWVGRDDAKLVGLCDPDPIRLAAAQTRWKVADVFADPRALLDAVQPDIVSVCTPDQTHGAVLEAVLTTPSVRAVLAEKPLTLDLEQAESLVRLAEARGVVLAVNYGRRSAPSHRRLKTWLETRPIGEIELVRGAYVRGIKHNGTHWLDLARFLVGEIAEIRGLGLTPPWEDDATIDAWLRFDTGAKGSLAGLRRAPYSLFEMDLIGSGGRVQILDGGRRFEIRQVAPSSAFEGFHELVTAQGPEGGIEDLVLHAVNDLMDAITQGRAPASGAREALAALRLADQALAGTRAEVTEEVRHAAAGR